MAQFIDVFEKYQGAINWAEVKTSGVSGVWIKATQGNSRANPPADDYVKGATAAGLLVGLYGYVTNVAGPVADADALAAEILRLQGSNKAHAVAPMLDFEDSTLPTNPTLARTWITTFMQRLRSKGVYACYIYESGSSWVSQNAIWPNTAEFNIADVLCIKMDAEYGVNNGIEHARTHMTGPVGAHQYTSTGRVSGVSGDVDRDDVTDIQSIMGKAAETGSTVTTPNPDVQAEQARMMALLWNQNMADVNKSYPNLVPDGIVNETNGVKQFLLDIKGNVDSAAGQNEAAFADLKASLVSLTQVVQTLVDKVAALGGTAVPGAGWAVGDPQTFTAIVTRVDQPSTAQTD